MSWKLIDQSLDVDKGSDQTFDLNISLDMCLCDTVNYSKCSKIMNASCLLKRPKQTGQTQIRMLLQKQSDQGLTCLLFCQEFCEFPP